MRTYLPTEIKLSQYKVALPLFVSTTNKYSAGLVLYFLAVLLYLPTNHYHLLSPQILPMSWIDQVVPFFPRSVWLYLSEYLFFALIYIQCRNPANLNKYFYSFLSLQLISAFIFILWPTTYPRHLFPLTQDLDSITYFTFEYLRNTDSPANCCPSLHVSSVYLSAFMYLDEDRRKFPLFLSWASIVAISTLTTKQHYVIDIVTGFLLALAVYLIFHKWVSYSPTKEPISRLEIDSKKS
jgi:membrane-associated phospholipid phosphatase